MIALAHRKWLPILLGQLVVACDERATRQPEAVIRDSAGIAIVENPLPETAPTYVVSEPILEIGELTGAEEYELHDVTAVAPLSDGSMAVATGGTEIRWYDADGRFLRRAGRQGGGPGEFRSIRYMRSLHGDSLLVFDNRNRRVTWFSSEGTYVRDQALGVAGERPPTVLGALRDGTLLIRTTSEIPPASTSLYRPRWDYSVQRGDRIHALRPYPGPETALHVAASGGSITSVFISGLPFARTAHATAGPDHFFVGSSDSFQIDMWSGSGDLIRIIRVDVAVQPVTEDLLEAYVNGEIERRRQLFEQRGQPFNEAEVRQQLREQRHAPAVPGYGSIIATANGGLWVQNYAMPSADSASMGWTIFDGDGRLAGVIHVPASFTPLYVEQGAIWGVWRDSLDVPYVHAYRYGLASRSDR